MAVENRSSTPYQPDNARILRATFDWCSGAARLALELGLTETQKSAPRPLDMTTAVIKRLNGEPVDEALIPHLQTTATLMVTLGQLLSPPKKSRSFRDVVWGRLRKEVFTHGRRIITKG